MFSIYISMYLLYLCTHRYKSILPTDQCHLNPRQHQRVGFLAAGEAGSSDRGGQPLPPRGCYNGQHKKTWKNGETRLEHDLLIIIDLLVVFSIFVHIFSSPKGISQTGILNGDVLCVTNDVLWLHLWSTIEMGWWTHQPIYFITAVPGTWVIGTSTGFTQNDGSLLMWLDFTIFYL